METALTAAEIEISTVKNHGRGKKWTGKAEKDSRRTLWEEAVNSCYLMPTEPTIGDFPELLRISEQFKNRGECAKTKNSQIKAI